MNQIIIFVFGVLLSCEYYLNVECAVECGIGNTQISTLIVGGQKATKGQFPWIASVEKNIGKGWKHICSGSILNEYFILTAAQCING